MKIGQWAATAGAIATLALGVSASGEMPDAKFAEKAASGGMMEIELGRHAVENARNPEVKRFGERMVEAHGQANDQLRQVAQQNEMELPSELLPEDRQQVERLKEMDGAEFDRAYMDAMVKAHQQNLKKFEAQADGDSPVDRWAEKQVPVLEQHLDLAKDVQQQVAGERGAGEPSAAAPAQRSQAPQRAEGAAGSR